MKLSCLFMICAGAFIVTEASAAAQRIEIPANPATIEAQSQQRTDASPAPAKVEESVPGIADNSFLVEEAYNQEYGVVQHISSFTRHWESRDWVYNFTQEWPFNPMPRIQLSYTITAEHAGDFPSAGAGIGDVALNFRYQVWNAGRIAFAPRVSLLLPSGNPNAGRGSGGTGVQFNLPLSLKVLKNLETHWNVGGTLVPKAENPAGEKAAVHGYNLGQSFIYKPHPRFNLMLETVFNSSEDVLAAGKTQRNHEVFISPGFRWAYNLKNGTQIVPGIGVPIGVGPSQGEVGVIFYFSIEHPFGKKQKAMPAPAVKFPASARKDRQPGS